MTHPLQIGIIGDFDPGNSSHIATIASLQHAANALLVDVNCSWLPTPLLDDKLNDISSAETVLERYDGLWCAPGSPYKNMAGALKAIQYARERDRPYIGT
jgi:CTP synthase (UTP-ammonia lyase)